MIYLLLFGVPVLVMTLCLVGYFKNTKNNFHTADNYLFGGIFFCVFWIGYGCLFAEIQTHMQKTLIPKSEYKIYHLDNRVEFTTPYGDIKSDTYDIVVHPEKVKLYHWENYNAFDLKTGEGISIEP